MNARRPFEHLLAPGRIGSLEIRNRILMSPMGSNLAEPDGHVGERLVRYYEERAKGGVGLIVVGVAAIAFPAGACNPNQVAISDDAFLPGLRELARRVHAHGARIAIQLQHAGKVAVRDIAAGRPMWVPSALPSRAGDLTRDLTPEELRRFVGTFTAPGARMAFHEMSVDDVARLVEAFAAAADRARRAGFDAVELHAGHGYILSSFLSPASNRRDDRYGGPIENRARFLVEALRAAKERTGGEFPVWCRIDGVEFRTEGGITVEDARRTAELAEAAGADAIHVSAYADASSAVAFTDAPLVHRRRGFVELAEGIKRRVRVPVIAVGRIEPAEGDALIAAGKADFIAMARKLLADPELPARLREGRPRDVRPCIYCYTCVGNIFLNDSTACAVNPATGREADFSLEAAAAPRRVLVVGGGPAGMEVARLAALRGHRVTLYEKGDRLGGALWFSSVLCEENGALLQWLQRQVRALPIELRLGEPVTPEVVAELAPEVVVVAVGARPRAPSIAGADRREVLSGDDLRRLLTGTGSVAIQKLRPPQRALAWVGRRLGLAGRPAFARGLSRWWLPVGRRVVVIGGGLVGVELAEFLCDRGRSVVLLEAGETLAAQMAPPRRWRVLHHLRQAGAQLHTRVRVESIGDEGVRFTGDDGESTSAPADTVVLAAAVAADRRLLEGLHGQVPELHAVGDCDHVGYLRGALEGAARVARRI